MSTTKERGILFSGAMVRAILAGRKTQTRRAVKPQPVAGVRHAPVVPPGRSGHGDRRWSGISDGHGRELRCPYAVDRLWVRETWSAPPGSDNPGEVAYRADGHHDETATWRPSLLMPRWASRITLAVESIRVERAQSISDADIEAEGVDAEAVSDLWHAATTKAKRETPLYVGSGPTLDERLPREHWRMAWTLINGRASWDANPWVWVVSFRREA